MEEKLISALSKNDLLSGEMILNDHNLKKCSFMNKTWKNRRIVNACIIKGYLNLQLVNRFRATYYLESTAWIFLLR